MLKKIALLVCVVVTIISCSSSDDGSGQPDVNFDRTAFLINTADNIISPAFLNFQTQVSAFDVARANFINTISQTNLDALSDAWLNAYKSWQTVEMFRIGLAATQSLDEEQGFVALFNRYPITVSLIENGAASGSYDLTSTNFYNGQGFGALDFLLHGNANTDTTALAKFTTNTNANGYINYLTDATSRLISLTNALVSDFQNNYRDTFINNTSSSASGSISVFVNAYINYYERGLRANKFGIPAGVFSNTSLPEKVEAFYKQDVSKELALEALEAFRNVFNGQAIVGSANGVSLASYLDALGRTDLKNSINNQFQEAEDKIQLLDANFVTQINTDNTKMTEAYDALQRAVVMLKVDMASAMNIAITFVDNDGD